MKKFASTLLAVPVLVALAGCPGGVAVEELGTEMAEMACPLYTECLGPFADAMFNGEDVCVQELSKQFQDDDVAKMQVGVERGTIVYDEGKMRQCLDEMKSLSCDAIDGPEPDVCAEAIAGQVEAGGDCDFHDECAGQAYCALEDTCPGTCTLLAAAGESCATSRCQAGLDCFEDTCVATPKAGEACGGGTKPDCGIGFTCIGEDEGAGQAGTCRADSDLMTASQGQSCDNDTVLCLDGLYCVYSDMENEVTTCEAEVASGATCFYGYITQCPAGEYCDIDVVGGETEGTCTPVPQANEPCVMSFFAPSCAAGLTCGEGDVCVPMKRLGEACDEGDDNMCYSDFCEGSVCAVDTDC